MNILVATGGEKLSSVPSYLAKNAQVLAEAKVPWVAQGNQIRARSTGRRLLMGAYRGDCFAVLKGC